MGKIQLIANITKYRCCDRSRVSTSSLESGQIPTEGRSGPAGRDQSYLYITSTPTQQHGRNNSPTTEPHFWGSGNLLLSISQHAHVAKSRRQQPGQRVET